MPDCEKVIDALRNAVVEGGVVKMSTEVRDIIIGLLKRQEASLPEMELFGDAYRAYRCPNCHKALFYQGQKFCDDCGKAVKWG